MKKTKFICTQNISFMSTKIKPRILQNREKTHDFAAVSRFHVILMDLTTILQVFQFYNQFETMKVSKIKKT